MASKVKVVKQQDLRDCGVACLESIIRHYGGNVPLEKLRVDTKTNKNGTTAYNLVYCAKKYGMDAAGYRMPKDQLKRDMVLPCIAHVNRNGLQHFIVIYEIFSTKLLVMDPAIGKKMIFINDLLNMWSGNVIMFYPKNKLPYIKKEKSILLQFWQYIIYDKKLFLSLFITNFILIFLIIGSSYYFKLGLDYSSDYFGLLVICFGSIIIFKCLFNYLKDNLERYLDKNLDVYLMNGFIKHLFRLPSSVIASRTIGEIVTRVNELNNIKGLFSELFVSFGLNMILAFITMLILYNFNRTLFLILFMSLLLYLLLGIISSKTIYKRVMQNIDLEDEFNTTLVENINCFQSIKNLNVTYSILDKIETKSSKYIFDKFDFSVFLVKIDNLKSFIGEVSIFLVNSCGFYLLNRQELTIGNLILFNSLMMFFLDPIKNLINSLPKYHFLKASLEKLNEFINISEEKDEKEDISITSYDITIIDASYSYNDFLQILKSINLTIKAGEHVMIVGPSGCGKSTLCKIISGIETLSSGEILLGNINYKDMSNKNITNNITYVSQHEHLYTDSIKNNIIFYRDIDWQNYSKIIKACRVEEIIDSKPLRHETIINMESDNFSGGEIQRIILARACLNDFKVLIIDEALSEVDYTLEKSIISNLREIFSDRTIIYISHKDHCNSFDRVINMGDLNEIN